MSAGGTLCFARDGAEQHPGAAAGILSDLQAVAAGLDDGRPGARIAGVPALMPLLAPAGPVGAVAALGLGTGARPVRAILFDKSATANWSLAWHQDRTICVAERIAVPGFGPWTIKQGLLHVAPPFALLATMVTVRVHLDDVPAGNAPLLVAPGSHRFGFVAEADIAAAVAHGGSRACLARAGDIWRYATPILHASTAASVPGRRRVLQVDYAAGDLPGGLTWTGV